MASRNVSTGPAEQPGMEWIPGGRFTMGSNFHYPEERPARTVEVAGFWIERTPVTNRAFARFVAQTGYVTVAEQPPRAEDYPGAPPENLRAGSLVFESPMAPVRLDGPPSWWHFIHGADWMHPQGPDSSIAGCEDHPVVHVAWADVTAYAAWAGMALPTEIEWERAGRGGLDGAIFAWGDELAPDGRAMANIWQGQFPYREDGADGWRGTSPVGSYPPNGFGLHDMIGNVWEWTSDWWSKSPTSGAPCCATSRHASACAGDPLQIARKVLKGGSHLCAPNYCRRYRPAARHPHPIDTSTSHVGFRCVIRPEL